MTDKPPHGVGDTNVGPLIMHRSTGVGVEVSCCICLLKDIDELSFHVPMQLFLCSLLSGISFGKT